MKTMILPSGLLAFALACGCGKSPSSSESSPAGPGQKTQDSSPAAVDSTIAFLDKEGDETMASPTKAEARQWMKQPGHVFTKADPKVVAQFVEDFYQAGALQVFFTDIEEHDGK